MADNTTLSVGTGDGDTFANDDIGGVKFPRGKITLGADGVNDGDVSSANPLPVTGTVAVTGVATAANQSTANTSLDSIDDKTPALGQALAAASVPVVLPAAQITTLTPPAAITGFATETTLAAIQTAVETIDNAISGSEMQVDIVSGSVGISGSVAVTGTFWQATQPVSLASVPSHAVTNAGTFAVQAAQSGTWNVGTVTTVTTVSAVTAITNALPTGTNTIGNATPAVATGGATPLKLISAATTNATSVKASAGTLYALVVTNTNAAVRYLKLYNLAVAPTVGTSTPVLTIAIPGNTAGAGVVVPIPACGIEFSTGIALALTTGAADSDTAAVALNEIIVCGAYK